MWAPTIEEIESIGWKLDTTHDFGWSFKWGSDLKYWNCPTLFICTPAENGKYRIRICKFEGQNDWYGKMDVAFKGKCTKFTELKLICKLIDLNDYKKFKL